MAHHFIYLTVVCLTAVLLGVTGQEDAEEAFPVGRSLEEKQEETIINDESGGPKSYSGPFCSDEHTVKTLPFCLNDDYEKHVRPKEGELLDIYTQMIIDEVEFVSDVNMTICFLVQFEMKWEEDRLQITNDTSKWNVSDPKQSSLKVIQNSQQ